MGVNYAFGVAADRTEAINFSEPKQELWLSGDKVNDRLVRNKKD